MTTSCSRCGAATMIVRDAETGLRVVADATPTTPGAPIPDSRRVLEHHPAAGWHAPVVPVHRGHPIHTAHIHNGKDSSS